MNLLDWANREIDIACKRENPNYGTDKEEWDYGVSCYKSALKAYNSMLEDGHSGMSWELTVGILNRLLHNQPLTPITDKDFCHDNDMICETEEDLAKRGLKSSIQCPRMSSLFKEETLDGKVTYHDVDRYYCFNIDEPDCTYSGGHASKIIDELFPIAMPYYPPKNKYVFACDEIGYNKDLRDIEMRAYYYITKPDGERQDINRFYKKVPEGEPVTTSYESASFEDENGNIIEGTKYTYTYQPSKWVDISAEEFYNRKSELENDSDKEE